MRSGTQGTQHPTTPDGAVPRLRDGARASFRLDWRLLLPIVIGAGLGALSLQLPLGTATRPGPGLWPLLCALLVIVAGAAAVRSQPPEDEQPFTRTSWTVLLAASSLVSFAVAMPLLGFELPLVALLMVWLRLLGAESWRLSTGMAVAATAALYLLFVTALSMPIPRLL